MTSLTSLVVVMSMLAVPVTSDCSSGIQNCLNILMDNVGQHGEDSSALCHDFNVYVKCVLDVCHLTEAQASTVINKAEEQMAAKGLNCKVDLSKLNTSDIQTTAAPHTPTTCTDAAMVCTKTYINNVFLQASSSTFQICPLVNQYVHCLVYSPCDLSSIKDMLKVKVEAELSKQGIYCDIKDPLYGRNSAPSWKSQLTFVFTLILTLTLV
ncbi:uncharacterized protein LOC131937415 isoform X2 [Physella acuta]|uniref:uncharacterized protein LOC131937415 isoform X2 n=1 Tax=Physella acuta TaxID=109671 RepID=UPI0027DCB76B|nr:uncharacterized protein LOC131937415 isoform X2 [Physella acuta]